MALTDLKIKNLRAKEKAYKLRTTIGAVFRYAIANGLAENDPTYVLRDALIRPRPKSRVVITNKEALVA